MTRLSRVSSGTFENLVLEDIDRIEVIRGPRATMWGSNAVNGVISITTKKVSNTEGAAVCRRRRNGTARRGHVSIRPLPREKCIYCVSARQTTRSSLSSTEGTDGGDAWNFTDLNSRVDWKPSATDSFTFELGGYRGVAGSTQTLVQTISPLTVGTAGLVANTGSHVIGRWNRSLNETSNLTLQFYYDDNNRNGWGAKDTDVLDFDIQHNFRIAERQEFMLGIGHRKILNRVDDSSSFGIIPANRDTHLSSAFVQDEITAVQDKLIVTLGSKFESFPQETTFSHRCTSCGWLHPDNRAGLLRPAPFVLPATSSVVCI